MTTAEPPSAAEERFQPVFGQEAFEVESPSAISSRAGQYLAMGTAAFGTDGQASDVRDDAEALGVPFVAPAGGEDLLWREQDRLDDLTRYALQDHGASDFREWQPQSPSRPDDEVALWRNVELTHSVPSLLALLNYSLGSEHELQRVAAATALTGFSRGGLAAADSILASALNSTDEHVAEIARAATGADLRTGELESPPREPRPGEAPFAGPPEVSIAVHGTWSQVAADPWYAPGRPLHSHIRSTSTSNLYNEVTYFTWSGEWSQHARDAGAADLPVWRDSLALPPLDTVFAHSHGGNVALTAAANGERIRMLVTMHTPALPRSDDQWAAIRAHVGRVLVMRTRLDHVVLADGLVTGSRQRFDQAKLPHKPVMLHWADKDAWFSHSFFTKLDSWTKFDLAGTIMRERVYAGELTVV